jgi:hypothetical protein
VDEAIGSGRIARPARRHRRQLQNLFFFHDGFGDCCFDDLL